MKKVILVVLFIAGLGSLAQAQLLNPGIEIGYGGFTPPMLSGDVKTRAEFFSNTVKGTETVTSTGAFHAAVYAKVWKVTVGVEGSYESMMVKNQFTYSSGNQTIGGEQKTNHNYVTAMARVQWNYWSFPGFKLYGGLAGGTYWVTSKLKENNSNETPDPKTSYESFAYQVTAIGASVGSNKVTVFLEGGYGFLGLVSGGVRFKLK
ncbi:MAG TPA: hypothetical protein VL547_03515 [Dinghuibacter sp.]|jgi:hypothetical protein|uniref:hypothetical protein n=1 Tax=Dinghuibacter sp. TaxID=2024697 RepID=UPI002C90138D|nr:hypothetical protein [Dinghuibacter sp.]HTJ11060.1 hypothetical protein [Dinghuibacter sp.]